MFNFTSIILWSLCNLLLVFCLSYFGLASSSKKTLHENLLWDKILYGLLNAQSGIVYRRYLKSWIALIMLSVSTLGLLNGMKKLFKDGQRNLAKIQSGQVYFASPASSWSCWRCSNAQLSLSGTLEILSWMFPCCRAVPSLWPWLMRCKTPCHWSWCSKSAANSCLAN